VTRTSTSPSKKKWSAMTGPIPPRAAWLPAPAARPPACLSR